MTTTISITDCPLYKLSSKSKLARLLGCKTQFLHNFRSSKGQYSLFTLPKKHDSKERRPIEDPKPYIKAMHNRLKNLLSPVELPGYLNSGRKGKSHIDNAKAHIGHPFCVTLDIKSFYQSGRKTFLYHMFRSTFQMSDDIAWLLADLVTINKEQKDSYFPTGSPISQLMIFWCYKQTFDEIDAFCRSKNITFSLYVDDMTFSSEHPISKSTIKHIIKRLKHVHLDINDGKTEFYNPNQAKLITGCALTKSGLQVRNKKRLDIIKSIKNSDINKMSASEIRPILGKITSQQQVTAGFMNPTKQKLLARQKNIRKTNKINPKGNNHQ